MPDPRRRGAAGQLRPGLARQPARSASRAALSCRRAAVAACLVAAAALAVTASTIRRLDDSRLGTADVDDTVARVMRRANVAGVGLAILNDGRVVYLKTYGQRDTEQHLPLTPASVMTAASFTKVAFATMVMQLVDERRLDLDQPIQAYLAQPLPQYPGYESLSDDARYRQITARMLLDHTAGFANLRLLEPDRRPHIHFEPGSRFAYSGQGLQLLQLVVETITGSGLEDLMRTRVFAPFGMTRTSMVWQSRFESDFANGYDEQGKSLGPERRRRADAAGSMQTTIADFARFLEAVTAGKGMSARARRSMFTPQISIRSRHQFPTLDTETTSANDAIHLSYGLGWGLYRSPYGLAFFKEGHDDGWDHYTVTFAQSRDGIIIMTNSSNGRDMFAELLDALQRNTFTPLEWEGFKR